MRDEDLTLDTPLDLIMGLDLLETEDDFLESLFSGFETLAGQVKVGANILNLQAEVKTVADWDPGTFPRGIPPDTKTYSIHWVVSFSTAQALLWAKEEAGGDYAAEICDHWPNWWYGQCPCDGLEDRYGELMEDFGELVDEWRVWKEAIEEEDF